MACSELWKECLVFYLFRYICSVYVTFAYLRLRVGSKFWQSTKRKAENLKSNLPIYTINKHLSQLNKHAKAQSKANWQMTSDTEIATRKSGKKNKSEKWEKPARKNSWANLASKKHMTNYEKTRRALHERKRERGRHREIERERGRERERVLSTQSKSIFTIKSNGRIL